MQARQLHPIAKWLLVLLIAVGSFVVVFIGWAWTGVTIPDAVEPIQPVCDISNTATTNEEDNSSPTTIKALSFNAQYMAGKGYVFFYDVEGGPDTKPNNLDIDITISRVAEIIADEDPDVVFLQEVNDDDDSRTHYRDQLRELREELAQRMGPTGDSGLYNHPYPCYASTHYWKATFVPHPKIMGPVSMMLTTLSKHPITSANRYQLPLAPNDPISERFYFYRALLDTTIQLPNGETFHALNTHFDAWGAGTGVMEQQVATTLKRLRALDQEQAPWILGGDFNLLPPDGDRQRQQLHENNTGYYDATPPLASIYNYIYNPQDYSGAVPPLVDLTSNRAQQWYTHYPNNPAVDGPDRTIDYIFYSKQWQPIEVSVRQQDTLDISDHLPVIAELELH